MQNNMERGQRQVDERGGNGQRAVRHARRGSGDSNDAILLALPINHESTPPPAHLLLLLHLPFITVLHLDKGIRALNYYCFVPDTMEPLTAVHWAAEKSGR